ncbi:MAG TPA: tRNA lysidine(34) synthetase TilS [Polyangiaceae bacterium]|jgi:tRNA(Ile)-lysidine synthase|nr:tRNA lysidine(34) synthetase TilS [Polyangiaceae bacterium]
MARSHPPTLITLVGRTLREECGVVRGTRVLLALSGGGDSMALLHVLAILAKKQGFSLVAHGVDHGLRAEAAAELDAAQAQCAALGVEFSRTVLALEGGGNLQARARDARRAALLTAAKSSEAERIATAHHADDRAETLLLRLMRGSGPNGLAVLPPRAEVWIRPQCRARKSDVLAHLARHRLAFADDPSNANRRFLRTRVRSELLPLLEQLSPQIVGHLCALADALAAGRSSELPLLDDQGVALLLNRAQRQLVGRARSLGQRSARVSLPHGRELSLDPVTLEPQVALAGKRPRKR